MLTKVKYFSVLLIHKVSLTKTIKMQVKSGLDCILQQDLFVMGH